VSTHLTRPLRGCRLRDCGAPDCPTCYGESAARQYRAEQECEHDAHDDGHCVHCGAEIADTELREEGEPRRSEGAKPIL